MKLLSYVREIAVDNSANNANFFTDIQKKLLAKNYKEYFKRRALHHYAKYVSDEVYRNKAIEFGLSTITREFSLKDKRPLIVNDRKKADLSYIPVKANDWIDDIEININIERKRILFLNSSYKSHQGNLLFNLSWLRWIYPIL